MSRLVVAIAHVEFTIANQTLYVVKVQQDADEWHVRRTYSDFRKLRDDVARVMKRDSSADTCSQQFAAATHELPFPAKRLFGSRSNRVVRERAVELHQFLIKLLLLTHTYRKAQKQLYDSPATQSQPLAHQASASVFFLLRDFLKPVASVQTTGDAMLSSAHSSGDDDAAMRRMIRESKMLAMRSSSGLQAQQQLSHAQTSALKTMSAPDVLAYDSDTATTSTATPDLLLLRQQSSIPILEERPAAAPSTGKKKTLASALLRTRSRSRSRSHRTDSHSDRDATNTRFRNVSNASSSAASSLSTSDARIASSAAAAVEVVASARSAPISIAPPPPPSSTTSVYPHGSAPASTSSAAYPPSSNAPPPSSSTSSAAYPPSSNAPPPSSSTSSTAYATSSNTQANARMYAMFYEDSDDESAATAKPLGSTSSAHHVYEAPSKATEQATAATTSSISTKKKPAAAATRTKTRSASAREARNSERKSKLSPQLTAQAVTLAAQRELEQYVTEYSAIMVLRYVDRFINKAVTKAPGCYTVHHDRLVIDSERFFEELDETFKDLPAALEHNFRSSGDWGFPPALDTYVQMKWKSFQGHAPSSSTSTMSGARSRSTRASKSRRSRRAPAAASESDSDETEYEYEETLGGGYMKPKRVFTDEVADVLDKMIAEGTAGRDQMLRLRRQKNEMGWDRRANPSGRDFGGPKASAEYWTDTEDDEQRQKSSDMGSSGHDDSASRRSTAVEHYQQKYNALRKERLSRHAEGGLV